MSSKHFTTKEQLEILKELGASENYFSYGTRHLALAGTTGNNKFVRVSRPIFTGYYDLEKTFYDLEKTFASGLKIVIDPGGTLRIYSSNPPAHKQILIEEAKELIKQDEKIKNFK